MASSNYGCCYSSVTVNHHSITRTPALHMEYMPPPLHTLLSCEAVPSWSELNDFFLFPDFNHGDSIAEVEPLPTMEESEEELLWLDAALNHSVPDLSQEEPNPCLSTCSNYDKSAVSSDDLSSSNGSVLSESDFSSFSAPLSPTISFNSQFQPDSSFSPLPAASTSTHSTQNQQQQQQEAVMFIIKGDGDTLYDGYSWRKYGEKSIKNRAYRRRYYRCGHDGCKVKKQAEQSTENPLEFHITYYGRHNHSAITEFSNTGYNQMPYRFGYPDL